MDYAAATAYLFARLPMFHRIGAAAYKADLGNIVAFSEALGHPERKYPTVHVGGTNGKGSVSSMLSSILMEAGYTTGLFTSPHLSSFTERIRVNGKMISEEAVAEFVTNNQSLIERIEPSFFEATTAMAFDYFNQCKVDIAVIEVGMGGRLDSTNIISPEAVAITSISFDHAQFLGNTLALIAGEKAGIMKPAIEVVIGQDANETRPVFEEKAKECGATLVFAESRYKAIRTKSDFSKQQFLVWEDDTIRFEALECDLPGFYQRHNIPTVLCLVDALRKKGWNVPEDAVAQGIKKSSFNSGLKGRMSLLNEKPRAIADIAHNEAGVKEVLAQIATLDFRRLHIVWGMVEDKDLAKTLALLPRDAQYYFVKPDLPRGLSLDILVPAANQAGLQGEGCPSVQAGYQAALAQADEADLIYVGGSTFVVAEVI